MLCLWRHSRPGWMEFWAPWSSCRCPCSLQGSRSRWSLKIPSNSNCSVVLWLYDSILYLKRPWTPVWELIKWKYPQYRSDVNRVVRKGMLPECAEQQWPAGHPAPSDSLAAPMLCPPGWLQRGQLCCPQLPDFLRLALHFSINLCHLVTVWWALLLSLTLWGCVFRRKKKEKRKKEKDQGKKNCGRDLKV